MKKITYSIILFVCCIAYTANAQTSLRYKNEVFTDAQIQVAKGIPFATNLNWLIMNTAALTPGNAPKWIPELTFLKTAVATGQVATIPVKYYMPNSPATQPADSTTLKVTTLKMDAYMPSVTADPGTKRPIVIYLHTGNFLPPGINGSPCGDKADSVIKDICMGFARRGFVALAIDYRLGWNPISTSLATRRGTLLNAVYRSIHDVKACVRVIKGANMASYNLDTTNIALIGEGTGGYIAHAYNTLDKYPEFMALSKFAGIIDTASVGYIDGSMGRFNLYPKSNIGTKVKVIGTLGGALADTTWLEAGDAPTISMQCVRDPFAPFGYGLVIVPPPINQSVVDVDGANNTIMRAQRLGNNAVFVGIPSADPYTIKARSLYNKTVSYILPPPDDNINIRSGEGMYPFLLPKAGTQFNNQASPWQWWDSASKEGTYQVAAGVTAHMSSKTSNTDMSKAKSRRYQDTIFGYMGRRFAVAMGLLTADQLAISNVKISGVKVFPNPATNSLTISYKELINSITITDITGKIVYETLVNNTNYTIQSLNIKQGLYIVNIFTSQGNAVEKLIIK